MESTNLYQQVLGLASPWRVADVDLNLKEKTVQVTVIDDGSVAYRCPTCDLACPGYDHQSRR